MSKRPWVSRRWSVRFWQRFDVQLRDDPDAYFPAIGILIAAAMSALITSLLYHLAMLNLFGVFRPLMLGLGAVLIPGSQGSDPRAGFLGLNAGVFVSYFLILVSWWIFDLRLPGVTVERLPWVVAIAYGMHALLAWQLFYPWLPL